MSTDLESLAVTPDVGAWRPMSLFCEVFYRLGAFVNANSACLLVLQGKLERERLQSAVTALAQRHPLLRSKVVRRGMRLGWQALAAAPQVRYVALPQPLAGAMEWLVNQAWSTSFVLEQEGAFAVQVFEDADRTVLQLVTSHVAEDARASYQIAHDLAQLYGGAGMTPPVVAPPAADMNRYLVRAGARQWCGHVWRAMRSSVRDLLCTDATLALPATSATQQRRFDLHDVTPAQFAALKAQAARRGCTVHALMLLAVCRIIGRAQSRPGRTIRLIDMFSLRGMGAEPLDSLYENVVLPYQIHVRHGGDDAMLAQIGARVAAMKGGEFRTEFLRFKFCNAVLALCRGGRIGRWLVQRMVQARTLITNPGRIPFPLRQFGPLPVLEFFSYAQLFPPGAVMCQFSGWQDRLRIITVADPRLGEASGQPAFGAQLLAELAELAPPQSFSTHSLEHPCIQ